MVSGAPGSRVLRSAVMRTSFAYRGQVAKRPECGSSLPDVVDVGRTALSVPPWERGHPGRPGWVAEPGRPGWPRSQRLAPEERQQLGVDLILVGRRDAVRRARVVDLF